jgi:hypothetical protein
MPATIITKPVSQTEHTHRSSSPTCSRVRPRAPPPPIDPPKNVSNCTWTIVNKMNLLVQKFSSLTPSDHKKSGGPAQRSCMSIILLVGIPKTHHHHKQRAPSRRGWRNPCQHRPCHLPCLPSPPSGPPLHNGRRRPSCCHRTAPATMHRHKACNTQHDNEAWFPCLQFSGAWTNSYDYTCSKRSDDHRTHQTLKASHLIGFTNLFEGLFCPWLLVHVLHKESSLAWAVTLVAQCTCLLYWCEDQLCLSPCPTPR